MRSWDVRPSRSQLVGALGAAAQELRTQSDFYVRLVAGFLGLIRPGPDDPAPVVLPVNVLTPPVETKNGLPGQRSSLLLFELGDGEAMIVTVAASRFPYQGFQVGNLFFESFDYTRFQTSLTTAQARRDGDGLYRFVLSPSDPGVPNWIDTRGELRGFAFMRWQGLDEDLSNDEFPTLKIVPLNQVRSALPADTPHVSPADRRRALGHRTALLARRFAATDSVVVELARRVRELDRAVAPACRPSTALPPNGTRTGLL